MTGSSTFTLTIPDDAWWDAEGDGSRLLAILDINGTLHHLEALCVIEHDGEQRARNEAFEEALSALYQFGGSDPFETTQIGDANYVIAVTPFQ
jgi:hypothetical protein